MSFLILFAVIAAAFVLLRPVGALESGLVADFAPWARAVGAKNVGSAVIPHGTVVARYTGATDTSASVKALNNAIGAIAPGYQNYELIGIANAANGRSCAVGNAFEVITAGWCRAKVYVPASTALAIGTELTIASSWDATNNAIVFGTAGTYTAPTNPGVLEAVYMDAPSSALVAIPPVNPIARLGQAISSGLARVEEVWVHVYPDHKPLRVFGQYNYTGTNTTTKTGLFILPACGPGILDYSWLQLLNQGSAGSVASSIFARRGSTPDTDQKLWSSDTSIVNDGTDGAIAGLGADGAGDTDNGGLGTAGTIGTLAAAAVRMFHSRSVIGGTLTYTGGTAQADVSLRTLVTFF